ncbi:alpha-hydroxy acid oxidase [Hydrogenophaga sp.]|uniref:alpha-hydroxy acid oxidase n=1 Tax=Hydrogenophaga sp. TaxID=1904254 RepID=UPI0026270022|nr:alpha-hydroxy acid oxidase [Hydrogenophaga sp.]MCW5653219.1 alpha-hydroxy-acid oxidizing protein [Hydrogenophaga sp.]
MAGSFQYRLRAERRPISVEGYRQAARRALPGMVWAYLDGSADDNVTAGDNTGSFQRWRLRQRVLTGHARVQLASRMAGTGLAMPLALAPTGLTGLSHWSGDPACARAAEAAGTRLVLSTASSYTLEEVASATEQNHWFQLYPFGDKPFVGGLLRRARDSGYTALFVTVDVPVRGNREGERISGMTVPPTLTPASVLDAALHPRWWWNLLRHRRLAAANYVSSGLRGAAAAVQSVRAQERFMQADLHWDDLAWMREQWKGPIYVKGLLDPDDAERAVDRIGVDGIVVSNHGGRQLDNVQASVDALPAIAARVGDRCEVLLDGGVRRGTDVIKALCLGARGVFIGRPYVYGLAADGEAGVRDVLAILRAEMERALVLMGCPSVAELDRGWLLPAPGCADHTRSEA